MMRGMFKTRAITSNKAGRWNLSDVKFEIFGLMNLNSRFEKRWKVISEIGTKLVVKSPVLSQIFIHSSKDTPPRRSWFITQKCEVDDHFWECFESGRRVINLFDSFQIPRETEPGTTGSPIISHKMRQQDREPCRKQ